jgi:hypothetical protein
VLNFLNSYASAIQAVSTVVLVCITAWYVALTRTLAEAASGQLRGQREAAEARRRELHTSIYYLSAMMETLPGPTTDRQFMANAMMRVLDWGDFDFGQFRSLASEVGVRAGTSASVVESRMKWLADQLRSVKSVDPRVGFDWDHFDWRVWNNSLNESREALQEIRKELEREVASGP